MSKKTEKSLAQRDREMIEAYMDLSRIGCQCLEDIASGRAVDEDALLKATSRFRTTVKNRHKAAKKVHL